MITAIGDIWGNVNDLPASVIEKFWKNIRKDTAVFGCWTWTGNLTSRGAPCIRLWKPWKEYSARRVSLQVAGKLVKDNDYAQPLVCQNKLCVNPDHLVCGDEDRFWNSVQKLSEASGGCWAWLGEQDKNMYGTYDLHENGEIIRYRAHHYSWLLHTGREVPKRLMLCHKCDHPYCVNPDHLFLGTHKDNALDMMQKERGKSPLTTKNIKEIRELALTNSYKDIAVKYGVSSSCITGIVNRKRWAHVN